MVTVTGQRARRHSRRTSRKRSPSFLRGSITSHQPRSHNYGEGPLQARLRSRLSDPSGLYYGACTTKSIFVLIFLGRAVYHKWWTDIMRMIIGRLSQSLLHVPQNGSGRVPVYPSEHHIHLSCPRCGVGILLKYEIGTHSQLRSGSRHL